MFGFGGNAEERLREGELLFHGYATIRRVHFDIRTPEAPLIEWQWPRFVSEPAPPHPGFYFAPDIERRNPLLGTTEEFEQEAMQEALDAGKDILFPGDTVRVGKVRLVETTEDQLVADVDRSAAVIDLVVDRSSGALDRLRPLLLLRRGNMLMADAEDALTRLTWRLNALTDDGESTVSDLHSLSKILALGTAAFEKRLADLYPPEKAQGLLGGLDRLLAQAELKRLLNTAALYGYRQARIEAAQSVEPLAREFLGDCQRRSHGQKIGKEKRTQWMAPALQIARAFVAQNPSESDEKVALEIKVSLRGSATNPPGVGRIAKVVAGWRAAGELPHRLQRPAKKSSVAS